METILILLIVAVGAMLAWNLNLHKQIKTCRSEKGCSECDKNNVSNDIKEAVSSLLRVVDKTKIIESLQFDETCKRELLEEIKSLIFFDDLKDAKKYYERLKQKENAYNERTWNVQENQALVKMYHELVCYTKHHIKTSDKK